MGRKDFSDLEDQIVSTVKSALDAIDFVNLKRDISDKTEDTLNEFKSKLKEYNVKVESKYGFLNKNTLFNIWLDWKRSFWSFGIYIPNIHVIF